MKTLPRPDIHHYDRLLVNAMAFLDGDSWLLPSNRTTIKEFLEYTQAEGLSAPRRVQHIIVLRNLLKLLKKPFRRFGKADPIGRLPTRERRHIPRDEASCERVNQKILYKWLRRSEDDYPNEVKWIKASVKKSDKTLPENISPKAK